MSTHVLFLWRNKKILSRYQFLCENMKYNAEYVKRDLTPQVSPEQHAHLQRLIRACSVHQYIQSIQTL